MDSAEGPIPVKKQKIFVLIPNDATDDELEIAAKILNGELPRETVIRRASTPTEPSPPLTDRSAD